MVLFSVPSIAATLAVRILWKTGRLNTPLAAYYDEGTIELLYYNVTIFETALSLFAEAFRRQEDSPMITVQPPLEYLITSSQAGLESFEHSRLWRCGNLRKELRDLFEECIEAETQARVARWILECRRNQDASGHSNENLKSPDPICPFVANALGSGTLPLFDEHPHRAESPDMPQLAGHSARSRPIVLDHAEVPGLEAIPRSSRAADALNSLEYHLRSEADAIDFCPSESPIHPPQEDVLPDTPRHSALLPPRKSSYTKAIFAAVVTFSEPANDIPEQNHLFSGGEEPASQTSIRIQVGNPTTLSKSSRGISLPQIMKTRRCSPAPPPFAEISRTRRAV
jgi:hypothetical protein